MKFASFEKVIYLCVKITQKYSIMMAYLKLFWIFIKAQFCRIFLRRLNVSFKKVYGDEYVTFDVVPSKKILKEKELIRLSLYKSSVTGGGYYSTQIGDVKLNHVWLCPVTLFVLGRYPQYIYFRRIDKRIL